MTAGIVLAGAPSCAAKTGTYKLEKRSGAAQGGSKRYREVVINGAYHSGSYQGAFERLERSDAKVSRAVLRGRGGSNASLLPDPFTEEEVENGGPMEIL